MNFFEVLTKNETIYGSFSMIELSKNRPVPILNRKLETKGIKLRVLVHVDEGERSGSLFWKTECSIMRLILKRIEIEMFIDGCIDFHLMFGFYAFGKMENTHSMRIDITVTVPCFQIYLNDKGGFLRMESDRESSLEEIHPRELKGRIEEQNGSIMDHKIMDNGKISGGNGMATIQSVERCGQKMEFDVSLDKIIFGSIDKRSFLFRVRGERSDRSKIEFLFGGDRAGFKAHADFIRQITFKQCENLGRQFHEGCIGSPFKMGQKSHPMKEASEQHPSKMVGEFPMLVFPLIFCGLDRGS